MSVDVVTFGCRLNAYESEVMRQEAQAAERNGRRSIEDFRGNVRGAQLRRGRSFKVEPILGRAELIEPGNRERGRCGSDIRYRDLHAGSLKRRLQLLTERVIGELAEELAGSAKLRDRSRDVERSATRQRGDRARRSDDDVD